jgi:spore cortex biosynthesis protein YabQ
VTQENEFLLHAMEMGIFLAFVYDVLRVLRRVIPRGAVLTSLEDLAFWCFLTGEALRLLHYENHGILRWYAILATGAGIWAYERLASPLFLKYATLVMKKLLTGLFQVAKIIGKGVKCHGRKIFRRKAKARTPEEKKSCIPEASAEPRQHVFGNAGGVGHRCGDRGECRGPSEKD